MSVRLQRRGFLQQVLTGAAGTSLLLLEGSRSEVKPAISGAQKSKAAHKSFRGIIPIMQTPFRDDDEIDIESIKAEVNFIIEAGGHGMAWPQLASEFYVLTDEECMRISEIIVKEAGNRVPVIIGVQSTNYWKTSLKFAEHAESIGADGIISLPPFTSNAPAQSVAEFYKTLARTVPLPIFIQNSGGKWGTPMSTKDIIEIAREFPHIFYVKEEADPVTHRIGAMVEQGKDILGGVFSGAAGTTLLNELRRGCAGSMTGAGMVDVYVNIYENFIEGKKDKAQEIFNKMMSLQMFKKAAGGLELEKVILKRRGIFKNTKMRVAPYDVQWDAVDWEEFEVLYNSLKSYFNI